MQTGSKIAQVQKLRQQAKNLHGAQERWREQYSNRQRYDKQGFGFTLFTDRSSAFSVPKMAFEAYVGQYGNSSVSTAWTVDQDLVNRLLPKALNINLKAILDSMAALAEAEAADLLKGARAEMAEIEALLAEIDSPAPEVAA